MCVLALHGAGNPQIIRFLFSCARDVSLFVGVLSGLCCCCYHFHVAAFNVASVVGGIIARRRRRQPNCVLWGNSIFWQRKCAFFYPQCRVYERDRERRLGVPQRRRLATIIIIIIIIAFRTINDEESGKTVAGSESDVLFDMQMLSILRKI